MDDKILEKESMIRALSRFGMATMGIGGFKTKKLRRKWEPHQGRAECARRRRRIASGKLTAADGLMAGGKHD